jgi:hypothetical protein
MNEITAVIRLFEQLAPRRVDPWDPVTLRRLKVWLSDDVARVVDGLAGRPAFREQAAWVIRSLEPDCGSIARQVVDRLEQALLSVAKIQSKVLRNDRILAQMRSSFPPRSAVVEEAIEISSDHPRRAVERKMGSFDETEMEVTQLRQLCDQGLPGLRLIKPDDYFDPQPEILGRDGQRILSDGAMIVAFNPELHPVGNFILQCAIRRLEQRLNLLTQIRRKSSVAVSSLGRTYQDHERAEVAWEKLQAELAEFRRVFQSGPDMELRNACVILTQVFAAFHPSPDVSWLDLPKRLTAEIHGILLTRMRGHRGGELFERVNAALITAQRLYEDRKPGISAQEEAIARGDLVLIAEGRLLYWQQQVVNFSARAHQSAWETIVALANKRQVTESDLFGDKIAGRSGMAMRINRLKRLLPVSLRNLVKRGSEVRTYRLDIERSRIHLFGF